MIEEDFSNSAFMDELLCYIRVYLYRNEVYYTYYLNGQNYQITSKPGFADVYGDGIG